MKQLRYITILLLFITASHACGSSHDRIQGIWVPDPQYTGVLKSYSNITDFVSLLDSLNFNAIFVVSYAKSQTIYQSEVLYRNGVYPDMDSTNMLSPFMNAYGIPIPGSSGDPVKDLIREAHKHGIKVYFWYEFGFMADVKPVSAKNNPILAKHPDWAGIANDGKIANYNGQDHYFNAFHPEVQQFLIDLITEGIRRYPDIDGIQGDDRMPAMCINSGYDPYTSGKYKQETGATPPSDYTDSLWTRWRLDILNDFGKTLYQKAKTEKRGLNISFAPNPYPWSRDNLLQEWPEWVNAGICDLIAVQCYRRDSTSYANTVKQVQSYIRKPAGKKVLFCPGVLLMVNGKTSDPKVFRQQMRANRALGTDGEILFYNEGLDDPEIQAVIKEFYLNGKERSRQKLQK